jgi:prepilin-type N-terminal cleavage/methylation domain-containing protein
MPNSRPVATERLLERGRTLLELVVVMAVLGLMTAAAIPTLAEARRAAALRELSGRLWGMLVRCRAHAIMRVKATALVFERTDSGGWRCFIAEDGDGDGLRRRDLESGRDRLIGEVLHLEGHTAGLGILQGRTIPDPSGWGRLRGDMSDPVRAGRGDIITFTPRSTATPSSIYMTDHHGRMRVLRVTPGTARVYTLVWRVGWEEWRKQGL